LSPRVWSPQPIAPKALADLYLQRWDVELVLSVTSKRTHGDGTCFVAKPRHGSEGNSDVYSLQYTRFQVADEQCGQSANSLGVKSVSKAKRAS